MSQQVWTPLIEGGMQIGIYDSVSILVTQDLLKGWVMPLKLLLCVHCMLCTRLSACVHPITHEQWVLL